MPLLEHVFKRYGSSCHAFARGADCGSRHGSIHYQPTRSHPPHLAPLYMRSPPPVLTSTPTPSAPPHGSDRGVAPHRAGILVSIV